MVRVLGLSASLRNARRGPGNLELIDDLKKLESQDSLFRYLQQQATVRRKDLEAAGRLDQLPFDNTFERLMKLNGNKGLSNSEVALAAALWSAHQAGADIFHVSLAEHFSERSTRKGIGQLKQELSAADALLVSGPVYFGDRGSLAQSLVNLIREDKELSMHLYNKVYAGIAVGAKRNGGQETTLIYQLWDMLNSGLLAVGNDSETTSQYGGTGHAGDVGDMPNDHYGLATSMGTGRRIAHVAKLLRIAQANRLKGLPRIAFLVLQNKGREVEQSLQQLVAPEFLRYSTILNICDENVVRCIACDICPTHIDVDETYRCIIKHRQDSMSEIHRELLNADALVPVIFSPKQRSGLRSNYQRFLERTRYLRRGDYVFSDFLASPIVIEEIGASENMGLRALTSLLRHHTILSKPTILHVNNGQEINLSEARQEFSATVQRAALVTAGRLGLYSQMDNGVQSKYRPIGYALSAAKDREDEKLNRRENVIKQRHLRARQNARDRLEELT